MMTAIDRLWSRLALYTVLFSVAAMSCALLGVAPASAAFGFHDFDTTFVNQDGSPATQAGSHPFAVETRFEINYTETGFFEWEPDEEVKDSIFQQVQGLTGDATAVPSCTTADFVENTCPIESQVGVVAVGIIYPTGWEGKPVYRLPSPPGAPVRIGFEVVSVRVVVDIGVKQGGDYNVLARQTNGPQEVPVYGAKLQLWGNPADPGHDHLRRGANFSCWHDSLVANFGVTADEVEFAPATEACPVEIGHPKPFLTLPTSCTGPAATSYSIDSWQKPGVWFGGSVFSHDNSIPPQPTGFSGCGRLGYVPTTESKATSNSAETGTGLDFSVDFTDEGLQSPSGLAQSASKKAEVILPPGMTINPSVGEGLGVCTVDDLNRETLHSGPNEGCPNSSKIGTLRLETPIVDEGIDGSIFLAEQDDPATTTPGAENPFDSLIALYFVLRNTDLGVIVKLPVKVEPDSESGQLVVTLDKVPQFPFSHFNAHLREGQRAALVTPSTCGSYVTESRLYPYSDPTVPRTVTSDFQITKGKGGGPCPPGGIPPFDPEFEAGSINNNAGSFSPFDMRLQREDGEQDMTKFSSVLPPGVLGSLSGVEKCGPYAVAVAKQKTGRQELADPSCPAGSEIGHTVAGAGVGSALTYVKGKIYLGGPYNGDPLSVIAITPAIAGPFDAGTVAVRLALTLNPKTAEVEVDGANSDPIPHILKGIVLKLRDLRVNVDRPDFTLNPTSCDESSTKATLFGSNVDVFNPADDVPVDLSTRYQAANCLNLGFKPHLGLHLKGGTRRGSYPGLKAVYSPKKGDANIKGLVVRLPRSAFLEQGHIRTICTRVQFAAKSCPAAARYGYVKAWTPLLDEPLQGPVYLRSSNHKLPDMVLDLHGLVDVEVGIRIDSAGGGIRATMEDAPDATLSRVILHMQGGKKGLIVNSRNICVKRGRNRANVVGTGQNGKQLKTNPVMQVRCANKRSHKRHRRARVARSSAVS